MNAVSIDQARNDLPRIVSQVADRSRGPVAISVDGREVAVILSRREFELLGELRQVKEFDAVFEDLEKAVR